ncbi:MAG: hypothetical protein ACOCRK_01135 [bacterium]
MSSKYSLNLYGQSKLVEESFKELPNPEPIKKPEVVIKEVVKDEKPFKPDKIKCILCGNKKTLKNFINTDTPTAIIISKVCRKCLDKKNVVCKPTKKAEKKKTEGKKLSFAEITKKAEKKKSDIPKTPSESEREVLKKTLKGDFKNLPTPTVVKNKMEIKDTPKDTPKDEKPGSLMYDIFDSDDDEKTENWGDIPEDE